MTCSHCQGADTLFNQRRAEADLRDYRRRGVGGTTKRLLDVLKSADVTGMSLLDVGGGVGVIQHELHAAGATEITDVDASSAYLRLAQQEANQRGYSGTYLHGDFVALAEKIAPADIVTMDRVICCYPNVEQLVETASHRATRYLGVVYPRDTWMVKLVFPIMNLFFKLQGNAFRIFAHPTRTVERIITDKAFHKIAQYNGWIWQVVVYARE